MKHANYLNSITVTDHALDCFLDVWANKAKCYNALTRRGLKLEAKTFYDEFWGMAEALRSMGIGYDVEYTEDLEYMTDLEIWCGGLKLSAKL